MTNLVISDPLEAVAAEFTRLADILGPRSDQTWDTVSLCAGWRVREVVAHMTMAVRYRPPDFMAELEACDGDFTLLSNRVAARDGALPTTTLLGNLRDGEMHRWTPPGGGVTGALSHVVIHALDITTPLDIARQPDFALLAVLDHLSTGGGHRNFGVDLAGVRLEATDADWAFGAGESIAGTAADLVLLLSGRELAPGRPALR